MNEHEFRQALHDTMTVAAQPEPMNEAPMLDLAKRARRRRQATWASAGSAVAVMAVVAGAMVLAPTATDGTPGVSVGDAGQDTQTSKGTEPNWPDGQTDATASAGPRYDQGVALMNELIGAAPDGYGTPDDLVYADPAYEGALLRHHQAADHAANGMWEYYAYVPVSADGGVGTLFAAVNPTPNGIVGEGCELSKALWGFNRGTCEEVTVGGTTVGVVTDTDPEAQFDQWVGFRHPDGTVVYVAQDNEYRDSGQAPLTELPFTAQQLAELATDARFHLD